MDNKTNMKKYFINERMWIWILPTIVIGVLITVALQLVVYYSCKERKVKVVEQKEKVN